jgi:hypothetical protein
MSALSDKGMARRDPMGWADFIENPMEIFNLQQCKTFLRIYKKDSENSETSIYKETAKIKKFDFLPCYILGITLTTNLIFYMLYPKGTYMIEHLNNQKQIQAYQLIYRNMQYQYYLAPFLGIIAVYLFGKSFCK